MIVTLLLFRENRYLLFLTENYAALQTLQHYLHGTVHTEHQSGHQGVEPFILFGSSFPKDKEYTQVLSDDGVIAEIVHVPYLC